MTDLRSITRKAAERVRHAAGRWWGGIGCRVSFFLTLALLLVAVLIGAFFFWEGKKTLDVEIRGRALYVAREVAALTTNDIITGNRFDIYNKLMPSFTASEDPSSGSDLLYLIVYNHTGKLLIGSTPSRVFYKSDSDHTVPSENKAARDDAFPGFDAGQLNEPVFHLKQNGIYDLILPVTTGKERVGFVRVGVSGKRYSEKFSGIVKKSAVALFCILLVGMAFSQIIAHGITDPILKLSEAVDKLSRQNWDTPLPVKGTDELSKLSHAFNQMALTLQQRDASLSRGNRDIFILHTAGLDLMESLDPSILLTKIAARAEDLIRTDTTAIAVMDSAARTMKYLGASGSKAKALNEMETPLEAGGIYNWIASYGTPLLIPNAQADFRLDGERMRSLGIKSIITVPLWSSNTMTGLLTAVNKKGGASFDKHDLRLFTVFSSLAAAALQNASLYNDLRGKIVELNAAQEQLVRSTKMAAIGELSANVAHEINNPLTSVLGYTTHLLKTLALPEAPKKILLMMEQETLRVRKIIRNLLDFARQKPSWMQPVDITIPIRETVALVQGMAAASSVQIHEEYPGSSFIVNMDSNEIKQVFINIVNNALQAMPNGGELRIRLKNRESDIIVEFADTGVGIAREHTGKIFEPFFSTKNDGDGTGLGLSISYRIIQNHGGRIEVDSEVGKGSVFKVFLPLHERNAVMRNV